LRAGLQDRVPDLHRQRVEIKVDSTPDVGEVAAEGAVSNPHRTALTIKDSSAVDDSSVAAKGAVGDRHRAAVIPDAAAEGGG
jgi:hypothetical protein